MDDASELARSRSCAIVRSWDERGLKTGEDWSGLVQGSRGYRDGLPVVQRLASIGVDEERVAELAGLIRRAGSLILQRPADRDQVVREIISWTHFARD